MPEKQPCFEKFWCLIASDTRNPQEFGARLGSRNTWQYELITSRCLARVHCSEFDRFSIVCLRTDELRTDLLIRITCNSKSMILRRGEGGGAFLPREGLFAWAKTPGEAFLPGQKSPGRHFCQGGKKDSYAGTYWACTSKIQVHSSGESNIYFSQVLYKFAKLRSCGH